jgi:hypothetical protein
MSEIVADVLVCPINKSFNPSELSSIMMEEGKYKMIYIIYSENCLSQTLNNSQV